MFQPGKRDSPRSTVTFVCCGAALAARARAHCQWLRGGRIRGRRAIAADYARTSMRDATSLPVASAVPSGNHMPSAFRDVAGRATPMNHTSSFPLAAKHPARTTPFSCAPPKNHTSSFPLAAKHPA